MKNIKKEIEQDRRGFIKKVLGGTIAGSLLLVIPATAEQIIEEIPGMKDDDGVFTKKRFTFVVDITACIGCGSCCIADKAEYNVPDHNYRTWVERYIIDDHDNVYVDSPNGGLDGYTKPREGLPNPTRDTFFVPKLCNMCEKPSCVQVCPVGATYKTEDGFILVDKTRCVGCSYCIQACPYGARYLHPETRTADKCTFCYHRITQGLAPACVEACPTGARVFGDLDSKASPMARFKRMNKLAVLKQSHNTEPKVLYANMDMEVN
jgi:tetrathionate reductase subunit B